MDLKIKEADALYQKINKKLLPDNKGRIVAIGTDSGSYFREIPS